MRGLRTEKEFDHCRKYNGMLYYTEEYVLYMFWDYGSKWARYPICKQFFHLKQVRQAVEKLIEIRSNE
jgi:hypothetical protein